MRINNIIFLALVLLCSVLPVFSFDNQVRIIVVPETEVAGEEYCLGDVAQLEGGDPAILAELAGISLGPAPRAGNFRWLYRSYLELALQRAGWPAGTYLLEMPSRVKIYGASQKITGGMLAETVNALVAEYASPEWREWWVENLNLPPEMTLPPGEVRIELENKPVRLSPGSLVLRLKIMLDGKEYRTIPVSGRLRVKAEVLVLKSDLEKGAVLTEDNYQREVREVTSNNALLESLAPGAFRTTRPLQAGKVLEDRDLEPVPTITKNSRVRIIARGTSLLVTVAGLALEDGKLGEEISVKNMESGAILRATVIGPDEVEVKL